MTSCAAMLFVLRTGQIEEISSRSKVFGIFEVYSFSFNLYNENCNYIFETRDQLTTDSRIGLQHVINH